MKCALFIDRRGGLLKCSKKWPIDCFDIEKKKIFFSFITAGQCWIQPSWQIQRVKDSKEQQFKFVVIPSYDLMLLPSEFSINNGMAEGIFYIENGITKYYVLDSINIHYYLGSSQPVPIERNEGLVLMLTRLSSKPFHPL